VISPQAILIASFKCDNGDELAVAPASSKTEFIWFQIFNNTQVRIRSSHYG
jgi:hypothetical protein